MKTRRLLSLFLLVVLLCGMVPTAMAAEAPGDAPDASSPTAQATPPGPGVPAAKAEADPLVRDGNPDGFVYKNGLIWPSDSSKEFDITVDGQTTHVERLSTFVIKSNGAYVPCYCIAPNVPYAIDGGYTPNQWTIQNAWDSLTEGQRKAIGLALLYGYPNGIHPTGYLDSKGAQGATQLIIWEICYGMRSGSFPYACTDTRYIDMYNEDDVGNEFTDGATGENNGWIYNLKSCYYTISEKMARHCEIPSFAAEDPSRAQTYEMTANEDGTFSVTLTDTNNLLSQCAFSNTAELSFSVSGNRLKITAKKPVTDVTVTAGKKVPNIHTQPFRVWTYPEKQSIAQPLTPTSDPQPFFFKLNVPAGALSIRKTTEDGKNLSGWQFEIYKDSACANRLSGPHVSGNDGTIQVPNLSPGTVWVKEIGHRDGTVNALYRCDSANPQKVTIVGGKTVEVAFYNKRNLGICQIVKTATNGGSVKGWHFAVTDSGGNAVGNYVTDDSGIITIDLAPGTYTVTETDGPREYWVNDPNPTRTVTVKSGETAKVTFRNQWIGKVKIVKGLANPEAGSVEGWTFTIHKVTEKDGAIRADYIATVKTGPDGRILQDLEPGNYRIAEKLEKDSLWQCTSKNPQTVTVKAGQTAEVRFTNTLRPGKIAIQKVDPRGEPLEGVEFLLEWSENGSHWQPVHFTDSTAPQIGGCTAKGLTDGKLVSGEDGLVTFSGLYPTLRYRLTETATKDGYQLLSGCAYEGKLPVDDLTVSLRVVNAPVFTLPRTGSHALMRITLCSLLCLGICAAALITLRKKKEV